MLIDGHGRTVDYLRISVTQRCNFRCKYCMPKTPFSWEPRENLLSFEELFLFVKVCLDEGVKKIRITGGEPLLRKDLDKFIAMINEHNPEVDLAITTNGFMLKHYAKALKNAGLKRINMSLDSLNPKKAKFIAQKSVLHEVLAGLDAALEAGLKVKLNTVALRGVNDDEIVSLLEFARSWRHRPAQTRLLRELQPHPPHGRGASHSVPVFRGCDEYKRRREKGRCRRCERDLAPGAAKQA